MVTLTRVLSPVTHDSFGSDSASIVAVYSPGSVTVTLHLPRSSLVAVSSKQSGPVTLTSAPSTTSTSVRIVPLMQPSLAVPAKHVSALAGEAATSEGEGCEQRGEDQPGDPCPCASRASARRNGRPRSRTVRREFTRASLRASARRPTTLRAV